MRGRALLGVWALLASLMSLNGIFRETVLTRALPRRAAEAISAALGIAIILATTRAFLHRASKQRDVKPARLSLVWTGLTVAFEFVFGHYVDRKSWRELASDYMLWRGRLWPLVLLTLVASPFLWSRKRRPEPVRLAP